MLNYKKTINKIYEETFGSLPTDYEWGLEENFHKKLSYKDWLNLNKETLRNNLECKTKNLENNKEETLMEIVKDCSQIIVEEVKKYMLNGFLVTYDSNNRIIQIIDKEANATKGE